MPECMSTFNQGLSLLSSPTHINMPPFAPSSHPPSSTTNKSPQLPMDEYRGKGADAGLAERSRRIRMAAEVGLARSSRGRHWSSALRRRLMRKGCGGGRKNEPAAANPAVEEPAVGEDEEEVVVETRVRALQRLVPGGEELGVERLFEETADYIEALQGQVSAMRALACLLDELESERRRRMMMMGG